MLKGIALQGPPGGAPGQNDLGAGGQISLGEDPLGDPFDQPADVDDKALPIGFLADRDRAVENQMAGRGHLTHHRLQADVDRRRGVGLEGLLGEIVDVGRLSSGDCPLPICVDP